MKLQELLKDVAVKNSTAAQDMEIKEVRYDSRAVQTVISMRQLSSKKMA